MTSHATEAADALRMLGLRTDRAGRTPMERIEAHIARDWLGNRKQYELPLEDRK